MQIKTDFKATNGLTLVLLLTLFITNLCMAQNYTVCKGENVEVGPFPDPPAALDRPSGPVGSGDYGLPACISLRKNISPNNSVVSTTYNGYILSPQVTTTYTYTAFYGGGSPNGCNPGDEFSTTFTVFVEDCIDTCETGSSPDCPSTFENYTICNGESVETIIFPHPADAIDSPDLPACTTLIGDISPFDGVISQVLNNDHISYILAPTTTTTYIYTTYYGSSPTSPNCYSGETYSLSFTVFVEEDCVSENTYTICEGKSIEIGPFADPPIAPQGPIGTTPCQGINRSISPTNGVVERNENTYVVAPDVTTTYTITSRRGPSAPGSNCHSGSANLIETVKVIVLPLGTSPDCSEVTETVFDDYPWLSSVVDIDNCNGTTVTVYDAGTFNYLFVATNAGAALYFQDGTYYCTERTNFSCINAYNLTDVVDTWTCGTTTTSICDLLPEAGPCDADIKRFYYDKTAGDCLQFSYGGCDGNANNFDNYFVCMENACVTPIECPAGEPIEWDWIQRKIEYSDGCFPSSISAFEVAGVTYISTSVGSSGNFCPTDYPTTYYSCKGNYVCYAGGLTPPWVETGCNFGPTTNSRNIWTYSNDIVEGCTDPQAINYNPLATVDDGSCDYYVDNDKVFTDYTWLGDVVDRENCEGTTISVYDAGTFNYLFIETSTGAALYFQDGTYYCTERANFSCVDAYNLATVVDTWTCGLIAIDILGCTDALATNYNSEANIDDGSCTYPNGNGEIFDDYPWLSSVVDISNCLGTTVTVYDAGTFNYLFIETSNGAALYFQDGTYYCTERANFSCVDAYNLTEVVDDWTCGLIGIEILGCTDVLATNYNSDANIDDGSCTYPTGDDEIFDDYSWLSDVVNSTNCEGTTVTVYDAGAFNYLFIETSTGAALYFQDGTYYCTERANFSCVDAYNLTDVVDSWTCGLIGIEILGCTDPHAKNYNPAATVDDGSCTYRGPGDEIFDDFPWLNSVIDQNNCDGAAVTVYTTGTFNYLFVATNEGDALYFQDGTYYCTERPNFNCVEAYNLTEVIDAWSCGTTIGSSSNSKQTSNANIEASKKTHSNFKVKLYPNPTMGEFTVEFDQPVAASFSVNVFDVDGQLIQSLNAQTEQNIKVDLTSKPAGVYMVQLLSNDFTKMQKIIKH